MNVFTCKTGIYVLNALAAATHVRIFTSFFLHGLAGFFHFFLSIRISRISPLFFLTHGLAASPQTPERKEELKERLHPVVPTSKGQEKEE